MKKGPAVVRLIMTLVAGVSGVAIHQIIRSMTVHGPELCTFDTHQSTTNTHQEGIDSHGSVVNREAFANQQHAFLCQ